MSIKHETITISGTVLYCDGCRKRGPQAAYDDAEDCLDQAEMMKWTQDENDRDLCDECSKPKPRSKKKS
jgi:hypothetical protein